MTLSFRKSTFQVLCGAFGALMNVACMIPPTETLQAQFLTDLRTVELGLPNNLGFGVEYWNAAGVNIPRPGGGWFNGGTNLPDSIYVWDGLTIFNNADSSGTTNVNDPSYSTPLPALDALSGQ